MNKVVLVASGQRGEASGLPFLCHSGADQPHLTAWPAARQASSCLGENLVLGHFCPWADRAPSALAHKPQPVLATVCPRGQIQRELLPSEMLLRVELPISEPPAGSALCLLQPESEIHCTWRAFAKQIARKLELSAGRAVPGLCLRHVPLLCFLIPSGAQGLCCRRFIFLICW